MFMPKAEKVPGSEDPAKELFELFISPFQREFTGLGYHTELQFLVSPDAKVFQDSLFDTHSPSVADSRLDSMRPWAATVGYIPRESNLGFTRLVLPLKTPNHDEALVLQRTPEGYFVPLQRKNNTEVFYRGPAREDSKEPAEPLPIDPDFVKILLARAGYTLPELFTDPSDMRLALAELKNNASAWKTQETVVIPEDATSQTTITQTLSKHYSGTHSEFDVSLVAVPETISADGKLREQMVVAFEGHEYFIDLLHIYVQKLRLLRSDPDRANFESEYMVVKKQDIPVTPETLSSLVAAAVDILK